MSDDDYPEFLRRRAQLLGAASGALGADAGARADLAALQAEVDCLRAVQVAPGRVLGELNAMLSERVAALKYWARRLELEAEAAQRAADGSEGR
ncbi:MAG: hypothetical protein HYU78_04285 [Rhodocyclales bacterium]|nr:hypothetical protein [Rhodocyclales bacterium]